MALSRHNDDVQIHDGVSVPHASHSMDLVFVAFEGKTCVFIGIPSSFFDDVMLWLLLLILSGQGKYISVVSS
jgi:hypothetical protein